MAMKPMWSLCKKVKEVFPFVQSSEHLSVCGYPTEEAAKKAIEEIEEATPSIDKLLNDDTEQEEKDEEQKEDKEKSKDKDKDNKKKEEANKT